MSQRLERLERLHGMRVRLADAAGAELRRVTSNLLLTQETVRRLHAGEVSALAAAGGPETGWAEQQALLGVIRLQTEQVLVRRRDLEAERLAAAAAEHASIKHREQMRCIVERTGQQEARDEERRTQMRLDEIYAVARVRLAMANSF